MSSLGEILKMNNNDLSVFLNKITVGDALKLLDKLPDNAVDIILTDPPYFLDKLDAEWNHEQVSSTKNHYTVKSLPAGMKFDPAKGKDFYKWYLQVSKKLLRVLKPGGFFFSFSSPRLYHRLASAIDDAGFQIRDCFMWLYTQNQVKAMGLNHFIDRMDLDKADKAKLKERLKGWKTPQIKSCYEPIVMAQKAYEGTFLKNIIKHEMGLVNTMVKIGLNMFPSNILTIEHIEDAIDKYFLIPKPSKNEKGNFNGHRTVKPLTICTHLLQLTAFKKNAVILDPFIGSGTTAVAAKKLALNYIGFDINPEYVAVARRRLGMTKIRPEEIAPCVSMPDFWHQTLHAKQPHA